MAKGSNFITHKLRGKLGNLQLVKDPRYGEYMRSARGTIKPALLNDECQASSKRMVEANAPAKAIYNAVRNEHKDYFLWNRLVSVFRRQLKAGRAFHITDLKDLECSEKFQLDSLMLYTSYNIQIAKKDKHLCIDLAMDKHPDWSYLDWKRPFQYRMSIIVVYPNLATGHFIKETAHGPITAFTAPVEPLSFEIPVPEQGERWLAFLLANVCEGGNPSGLARTKGMRVVGMGALT